MSWGRCWSVPEKLWSRDKPRNLTILRSLLSITKRDSLSRIRWLMMERRRIWKNKSPQQTMRSWSIASRTPPSLYWTVRLKFYSKKAAMALMDIPLNDTLSPYRDFKHNPVRCHSLPSPAGPKYILSHIRSPLPNL